MVVKAPYVLMGKVVSYFKPKTGYRWNGGVLVDSGDAGLVGLLMPGNVAHWLVRGEEVEVRACCEPRPLKDYGVYGFSDYVLHRFWDGEPVLVWPPWRRVYTVRRGDEEIRVLAREAVSEEDYSGISELEQHHYASKEEVVGVWKCPKDGTMVEANTRPLCPKCGTPMVIHEIRGSLPSSRFLVLELLDRRPYEPRIVGYVRVDTPIPLMHRRIVKNGKVRVERLIREKVFPKDWFHPTFWPITPKERRQLVRRFKELASIYGRRLARTMLSHEISDVMLARVNTAAARIARVVVHPDYRGGGLGVTAAKAAVDWIAERRIPEMRRRKHVVETIAAMARYNPFFEKAGFRYMWDTASGRPVLMYPLSEEARRIIDEFLKSDPYARMHGGVLYRPRYKPAPPLEGPIVFRGVSKSYRSELSIEGLPSEIQEVLKAFGVERRLVERRVLESVDLEIRPGEVVAVVGASGAGKTTFLRLVLGAAGAVKGEQYQPDTGEIVVPGNAVVSALVPGEVEHEFGEGSLLEEITRLTGDVVESLEILSIAGISDAVLYRARIWELSTGQRERAKIAALLARRPNLVVIDEFAAHLDPVTAGWVARRLSKFARQHSVTLIVATHRREVLRNLYSDRVLVIAEGRVSESSGAEL